MYAPEAVHRLFLNKIFRRLGKEKTYFMNLERTVMKYFVTLKTARFCHNY